MKKIISNWFPSDDSKDEAGTGVVLKEMSEWTDNITFCSTVSATSSAGVTLTRPLWKILLSGLINKSQLSIQ